MSVEIWKGVCSAPITGECYDTEVTATRKHNAVYIEQESDGDDGEGADRIVMDEAQAIDIALCILRELAPGFYQALGEKQ